MHLPCFAFVKGQRQSRAPDYLLGVRPCLPPARPLKLDLVPASYKSWLPPRPFLWITTKPLLCPFPASPRWGMQDCGNKKSDSREMPSYSGRIRISEAKEMPLCTAEGR